MSRSVVSCLFQVGGERLGHSRQPEIGQMRPELLIHRTLAHRRSRFRCCRLMCLWYTPRSITVSVFGVAPIPAAMAKAVSVGGRFGFGLHGRLVANAARTTFSKASACSGKRTTRPRPRGTFRWVAISLPEPEKMLIVGSPRRQRTVTWVSITPGGAEYRLPHTDTNPLEETLRVGFPQPGTVIQAAPTTAPNRPTHRRWCYPAGGHHPPPHRSGRGFPVHGQDWLLWRCATTAAQHSGWPFPPPLSVEDDMVAIRSTRHRRAVPPRRRSTASMPSTRCGWSWLVVIHARNRPECDRAPTST